MNATIHPASWSSPNQGHRDDQDTLFIAEEGLFDQLLALERKRTERTGDPFVLMILDIADLNGSAPWERMAEICGAIRAETRDIDLLGWYKYSSAIGVFSPPCTRPSALRSCPRSPAKPTGLSAPPWNLPM